MRPSTSIPFGALFAIRGATALTHAGCPTRRFCAWVFFLAICAAAARAQALPATQDSSPEPSAPQAQPAPSGQAQPTVGAAPDSPAPSQDERLALLERVIANQKKDDLAQYTYERLERLEVQKGSSGTQSPEVKISRAVPAGTGIDRIPVGPDGKPLDAAAYRAELQKLERALSWAAQEGRAQRDAYDKIAKKQKERSDLIDTTRVAFLYTFIAREKRGDRILEKYQLAPNPAYHATSRATAMFAKVRGFVWIDVDAAQLARAEMEVTDDISIGGFLARIYKGSHFMQERYEMAPGLWFASYSQYDFDGRRLFVSFGIHERTSYSQYRRIGPPKEALQAIRAELGKTDSANADP